MKTITEERARDVAIAIIDIFEDLFADKDIYLPDDDREDDDFDDAVDDYDSNEDDCEACIYGSTYYDIEDYFTDLILDNFENLCTDSDIEDLCDSMIAYMNEILKDVDMEVIEGEREVEGDNEPICNTIQNQIRGEIFTKLVNNLFPVAKTGIKNADNYRICNSIVIPFDEFKEDFKRATGDNDADIFLDIDGINIKSSMGDIAYYPLLAKYFGVREVTGIHADDDVFYINVWVSFNN